jgi:uncharacterized protein (DUF58 family)
MQQRRLALTTRGVLALAIVLVGAVAGVLLGAEEFVLASIAAGTLLLWGLVQCAHRAHRARGVWRVEVVLPEADIEVNRLVDVVATAIATDGAAGAPLWLEDSHHSWAPHTPSASDQPRRLPLPNPGLVLRVRPGEPSTLGSPAPTGRRGVFTLRGLRLWSFDSFGLVARLVATGPSATVSVYPTPIFVELAEALLRGEEGPEDASLVVAPARSRRDSYGDFSGLRPYVPGDRLRLLHWPALARSGELMVRDFEDSGGPRRVQVVADVRPLLGAPGCEGVLAVAAGVGLRALAEGAVVELLTTRGERVVIGPGPHGPAALLRTVATIDTGTSAVRATRRFRRRSVASAWLDGYRVGKMTGTVLLVTTRDGAQALPGSLAFAHLVLVP